jgi:hypothetical protein
MPPSLFKNLKIKNKKLSINKWVTKNEGKKNSHPHPLQDYFKKKKWKQNHGLFPLQKLENIAKNLQSTKVLKNE